MRKSNFEQYQEFQDYTNYIDTSDVMLGFYKNQSGGGLEKYCLMIEEWLGLNPAPEDNLPLVIEAQGGVGKKTLLSRWYQYHQSVRGTRNDLVILHFGTTGGNNSNYFYAMYRILIKLREELNIDQKVELHQEKLRKYFGYWLDVCDQRIKNQAIKNIDVMYEKIILVFEGIDCFTDRTSGRQGNIAFWLPRAFPKNVKVIVTADRDSQSMAYFNKLGCQRVTIPYDPAVMRNMIQTHTSKPLCLTSPLCEKLLAQLEDGIRKGQVTSLFVKAYLNCLLPQQLSELPLSPEGLRKLQRIADTVDLFKLGSMKNVEELFDYLLEFWGGQLLKDENLFKEVISLLVSTQKGLTRGQILSMVRLEAEELQLFITVFRPFLMHFQELWMIKNDSFKKAINRKYNSIPISINEKIAQTLKRTPNSVRKLEEETFQLFCAGNYIKLKDVISDVENFLLLFNPYTKYDLCRYWQKLEERSFDPVIEYNKAIEGFQMHYHPTSDDLFRIITQISRFLREFSDFETYYTPDFRHPQLIGNHKQLQDIGILGEFRNLSLCEAEEGQEAAVSSAIEAQGEENSEKEEQKQLRKKLNEMYQRIEQGKHIKKGTTGEGDPPTRKQKKNKVVRIQQLNVEVRSNQQQFRNLYHQEIKGFLEKVSLQGQKEECPALEEGKDEDYEDSEQEDVSNGIVAKIRNFEKEKSRPENFKDLKTLYAKTVVQEFELNQKPPTNYYYKRWIWMQFPWVCMTMKCDYSEKLRKCFTSPTSYMSVAEERQFTLQALKIALQAKKKKQAILEKVQDAPSKPKKPKNIHSQSNSTLRAHQQSNANESAFQKDKPSRKGEDHSFVTHSFLSLHNLSKEVQSIAAKEDSKNSVFITAQNSGGNGYSTLLRSFQKKKRGGLNESANNGKQGLLPRIKQNANREMMRELQELEKNNESIRRQMDSYLYKNKILAKRLKELKIIEYNNQSQLKNERKIEEKKGKIAEIEQKIEKVKYQYAYSLLEHERLNVLIKICRRNKTHNEEAIPDLVLECNNFKKMIRIETDAIQQLKKKTEEVKKLTKKFVSNCYQRIENEASLNRQIEQTMRNRNQFQQQVDQYDQLIAEQVQQKRRQLQDLHQSAVNPHHSSNHEPSKKHNPQQDHHLEAYETLSKYINLDDENYQSQPAYQQLVDALAKQREFQAVLHERQATLSHLQSKYQEQKRELQTLNKASQDSSYQHTFQEEDEEDQNSTQNIEELEKELGEKKRVLQKVTAMKLGCLGMLNTLYTRLGLPEQSQLTITPEFLEKLEEAKVLSGAQTCYS